MKDSSRSKSGNIRPPPKTRRAAATSSAIPTSSFYNGRASPADDSRSAAPKTGTKRKKREFEDEIEAANSHAPNDETKIDVFVRCRGRNEKEVRENSGVVVSTDGVFGKTVELSTGPNALSKKSYLFDGVFSPMADQQMVFDEVATPILDEVMKGYNCTLFAYGQTGTGKTFTMCGDISDDTPALLPDDAGIIPRVLYSLFRKLDGLSGSAENGTAPEYAVKISFIELYNEELRDLLSVDDKVSLKIFDRDGKQGATTVIHGMEEQHITSAHRGLELLRDGSLKRQVGATKCNNLSSRSHTIFTITVYTKQSLETGEELVSSGKLNLVDLAGSENIGRSGAESKRAVEAGLINRSLLTLGRVINALVDRSPHIPYRESKLTRLLQDSLGGQTKTSIIATVSAATSNLEETISSLDYAFRAKNIKNKPQIKLMPKKTLLKEFAAEMEQLKADLTATRQRNGVYLTQETYEKLISESESNMTLVKEQREKLETTESKLSRKGRDLLELANDFDNVKKDHRALENDNTALHMKLERLSELHVQNRGQHGDTLRSVAGSAGLVEDRLAQFRMEQQNLVDGLSGRMETFVKSELEKLEQVTLEIKKTGTAFEQSHDEVVSQTKEGAEDLHNVLENAKTLRAELNANVGAGLDDLNQATTLISQGFMTEVRSFCAQLEVSYYNLGVNIKGAFDDVAKELIEQRKEIQRLQDEMAEANRQLLQKQSQSAKNLSDIVQRERVTRNEEDQALMQHIQKLISTNATQQQLRIDAIAEISDQLKSAGQSHHVADTSFTEGNERLMLRSKELTDEKLVKSCDEIRTQIEDDYAIASQHADNLKSATASGQKQTTDKMNDQIHHLQTELCTLDTIIESIQEKSIVSNDAKEQALSTLVSTARDSYTTAAHTFGASSERIKHLGHDVEEQAGGLRENLARIGEDADIVNELDDIRQRAKEENLEDYAPTGQTPMRRDVNHAASRYTHADAALEQASSHCAKNEPVLLSIPANPRKTQVFADKPDVSTAQAEENSNSASGGADNATSLRELDINTVHNATEGNATSTVPKTDSADGSVSSHKRPNILSASVASKVPHKKRGAISKILPGRENQGVHELDLNKGHSTVIPSERRLGSRDTRG